MWYRTIPWGYSIWITDKHDWVSSLDLTRLASPGTFSYEFLPQYHLARSNYLVRLRRGIDTKNIETHLRIPHWSFKSIASFMFPRQKVLGWTLFPFGRMRPTDKTFRSPIIQYKIKKLSIVSLILDVTVEQQDISYPVLLLSPLVSWSIGPDLVGLIGDCWLEEISIGICFHKHKKRWFTWKYCVILPYLHMLLLRSRFR